MSRIECHYRNRNNILPFIKLAWRKSQFKYPLMGQAFCAVLINIKFANVFQLVQKRKIT